MAFTISFQDGRIAILDERGKRLDRYSRHILMELLNRNYKPSAYLYLGYSDKLQLYKVGVSRNPNLRAQKLKINLIHVVPCSNRSIALRMEDELMQECRREDKHVYGEWFRLEANDITRIKKIRAEADFLYISVHPLLEQWWAESETEAS